MTDIPILDLALISAHVYRKNDRVGNDNDVQEWIIVGEAELANELLGTSAQDAKIPFSDQWGDGFYADAYKKNSSNELVVAFRGTDALVDFTTQNTALGLSGVVGQQLLYAYFFIESAKAFVAATDGITKITFTGHSLGGVVIE